MAERNLRILLLDLFEKNHLLSVGEVLEKLHQQGSTFNKTSVYRSLDQLENENKICKHFFSEAEAKYELHSDEHVHLVCRSCGKIQVSYQVPHLTEKDFLIEHSHVTLVGLCSNCQQQD